MVQDLYVLMITAAVVSIVFKLLKQPVVLGYTINGAKQLGIEASKGSIEAGKDADFLVFDNDLMTAKPEGISYNKPSEVYFCGCKIENEP
jgi:hypothetical protein